MDGVGDRPIFGARFTVAPIAKHLEIDQVVATVPRQRDDVIDMADSMEFYRYVNIESAPRLLRVPSARVDRKAWSSCCPRDRPYVAASSVPPSSRNRVIPVARKAKRRLDATGSRPA